MAPIGTGGSYHYSTITSPDVPNVLSKGSCTISLPNVPEVMSKGSSTVTSPDVPSTEENQTEIPSSDSLNYSTTLDHSYCKTGNKGDSDRSCEQFKAKDDKLQELTKLTGEVKREISTWKTKFLHKKKSFSFVRCEHVTKRCEH